jgi:hypothetical protein
VNRLIIVYDDSAQPLPEVTNIIGERKFGDIQMDRQSIRSAMFDLFSSIDANSEGLVFRLDCMEDIPLLCERIASVESRSGAKVRVLHYFSSFIFACRDTALATLKCCAFAERVYAAEQDGMPVFYTFPCTDEYAQFLSRAQEAGETDLPVRGVTTSDIRLNGGEFVHIGCADGLVACLTRRYDARFFNHLETSEYTVTKTSENREKIKAEYSFWHLLPDSMKMWFVMPFDYTETANTAGYSMERLHIPNLSVKYVHGAMDVGEFEDVLQRFFYFLDSRANRPVSRAGYASLADKTYLHKTDARIRRLKADPKYAPVAAMVASGTSYGTIDAVYERFVALYRSAFAALGGRPLAVVGHGDPCFSNILFDRATKTLKFVDPKGALTEDALWADPYYDLCKLSHSVCGLYDFFNSAIYEIALDDDLRLHLSIPFDNQAYQQAFKRYVELNGYDYRFVRIGEAALFLSMLPLHIDNPHKVLGFILNAIRIMDEIEAMD